MLNQAVGEREEREAKVHEHEIFIQNHSSNLSITKNKWSQP